MKHIYLNIPCDFSIGAINRMFELAKENNLGIATNADFYDEFDWCIRFEQGIVWSYQRSH